MEEVKNRFKKWGYHSNMTENAQETEHNPRLTSVELGNLWITYMDDNMFKCVLQYFIEKNEDKNIKPIFQYALDLTQKHLNTISEFLKMDNRPVPQGFTEEDVTKTAPRLFSDIFMLIYVNLSARYRLTIDALSLGDSSRADIRNFYSELTASITELFQKSTELMLEKGIYVRPPQMPTKGKIEFVKKQSYFNDWIGEHRPLNALEISQIFFNFTRNVIGSSLLTGFSQVSSSPKVRDYMIRGAEIAKKHVSIFSDLLQENDLPSPTFSDLEITDSTVSPFSDKLMMFHTTALTQGGIQFYGIGLSRSSRGDLTATYIRLMAETGLYAADGAKIMIKNKWMEQPPSLPSRKNSS